jgi:hypothetical protein
MLYMSETTYQGSDAEVPELTLQCDETKPICNRCEKASRECHYPKQVRTRVEKADKDEKRPASSGSEFSLNLDMSDDEPGREVVRFSSLCDSPDYFSSLTHVDQLKESLIHELLSSDPFSFISDIPFDTDSSTLTDIVPRSPKSNQPQHIQLFFKFHRETITAAHYFRYFDLPELHTKWLPAMAEQCECLRYAMVAFSALIYSIKSNPGAREVAFYYYAMALQGLRSMLDTDFECDYIVATALQLSTIDVHTFL